MIFYIKGYVIGNKMVGCMVNGDVYIFMLFEMDYVFMVDISNFKYIVQLNKYLFVSWVKFIVKEVICSDVMFDDYFYVVVVKLVSDK